MNSHHGLALPDDRMLAAEVLEPPASAFRKIAWSWRDLAIGLAPLLAWRLLLVPMGSNWMADLPWLVRVSMQLILVAWLLGYPVWLARRRGLPLCFPGWRKLTITAALAMPALMATWVGLTAVVLLWQRLVGPFRIINNPAERIIQSPDRGTVSWFVLLGVLIVPAAEELFFRGMLYNALRRYLPVGIALLLQAAAFGLLHPYGIAHGVAALYLGLVFALAYDWRRTLWMPITMHSLHKARAWNVLKPPVSLYNPSADPLRQAMLPTYAHPARTCARVLFFANKICPEWHAV